MPPLRIALLGAGAMGTIMARDIYPSLAAFVQVVAVVDHHPERGVPLATQLGATYYESLDAALVHEQLDGVDIRLQHVAHSSALIDALAHDLHVLVEKPLTTTDAECRGILNAVAHSSRTVAIAENYPHLKATKAARAAVDAGAIGEVLAIRTTREYTLDGVWSTTSWRQGAGDDAGILWDQGTHHTSLLRALGGEIRSVGARAAANLQTSGAETVVLDIQFESGLAAQSLYCWGTPAVSTATEAVILGSAGRIEISVDYEKQNGGARLVRPMAEPVELTDFESYYESHAWIVEDWIEAIRASRPPLVDVDSAAKDVRVVLAAQSSLRDGSAPVLLERGRV